MFDSILSTTPLPESGIPILQGNRGTENLREGPVLNRLVLKDA